MRHSKIVIASLAAFSANASAAPTVPNGINILTAEFGTLGKARKLDIVAPLRTLCGTGGETCSVFCSETSFGRYSLGHRPICRVTYRCPDETTRSVEAAREEPILLNCRAFLGGESVEQPATAGEIPPPPAGTAPSGL